MKYNSIDISGIAQAEEIPRISRECLFSEMCETYNFHIPPSKPNINKILKLFIDASIKETKIIDVPWGKRTIVEGMLHIKVFYSSDVYSKKIYYVHIDVPIYTFLASQNIVDIGILIEDAVIHKIDSRNISISCLLFIYPKLEEVDFHKGCTAYENDIDKCEHKDEDEYEDVEKEEKNSIYNYKMEDDTDINFQDTDVLEFSIEYDMNSCNLQDDYCEDKKKDCDSE